MNAPIEINVAAKKTDPWATPFIETVAQLKEAVEAGQLVGFFGTHPDEGLKLFDYYNASIPWGNDVEWEHFLKKYKLRAHLWGKVMLYQCIVRKVTFPAAGHVATVISAPSRKEFDRKIKAEKDAGRLVEQLGMVRWGRIENQYENLMVF